MVRRGALEVVRLVAPAALPRLLGWTAVAVAAATFLWTSPLSPCALWRADVLLTSGQPLAAVHIYEAVARENGMPGVRREALLRAADTWAADLAVPTEALRRLEALLREPMSPGARAELLDRIGELLLVADRPAEAAVRLREAHDLDPAAPGAAERLMASASASLLAKDHDQAEQSWRRLARLHPEHTGRAALGRADLALRQGRLQDALALYRTAVDHAFDPDVASVARLGAATCLERLGDAELALAELGEAALPPEVRDERVNTIRERGAR